MSSTTSKIKHQSFIYYINPINNKYSISRKELEILFYFIRGKTASEIALILNRSKRTIDMHIESIKNKFVVENKSHLIEKAMIEGYMNLLPETFIEKHHD
jgi:DNA-binding CsgD family transcriptional regulator